MEIIVFGDIHMATSEALSIPGIREADLIVLNGDLTNYGEIRHARSVLDDILRLNANVLAQFGNLDRPEINTYLEELGMNLHGQARLIDSKVCLVGIGGSNPTPFNTPSEYEEKELLAIGNEAFEQAHDFTALAAKLSGLIIPVIFVSHCPPFNSNVDRLHNGRPVGSRSIRSLIEKFRPDAVVCGHIHEAKGQDTITGIPVYNPGMLRKGGFVRLSIHNSQITAQVA